MTRVWVLAALLAAGCAETAPVSVVERSSVDMWAPRTDANECSPVRTTAEAARAYGVNPPSRAQVGAAERDGAPLWVFIVPRANAPAIVQSVASPERTTIPFVATTTQARCMEMNAADLATFDRERTRIAQAAQAMREEAERRRAANSEAERIRQAEATRSREQRSAEYVTRLRTASLAAGRAYQERFPSMPDGRTPASVRSVLSRSWWAPVQGEPFCEPVPNPGRWAQAQRYFRVSAEVVDFYQVPGDALDAQVYFYLQDPVIAFLSTDQGRCHRMHELMRWRYYPARG